MTVEAIQEVIQKLASKGKRPDKAERVEPGDNARYLKHSLRLANLPPVNMKDPEEVKYRINQYFNICIEDDMKPGVAALAVSFGLDRRDLWRYREGQIGKNPEVRDLLKRACHLVETQMESYMQNGKINPVSGIFLMKANFGYEDKQTIEVRQKPEEIPATDEELRLKYQEAAGLIEGETDPRNA